MINSPNVRDLNPTTLYQIIQKFNPDPSFQEHMFHKFLDYRFEDLETDVLTSAEDYYNQQKFTEEDLSEIKELLVSLREN
ncbi:hypothetical protein [Bacillus sp. FJAT-45350]|uniref:hypothetical protein n=1 Tax=Bacillus sp. FJAT-45350 TaxID=2011014 RepID=UPI000BB822E4|nr:hypothetical protein [Bacillus sp. FJAT-45350]